MDTILSLVSELSSNAISSGLTNNLTEFPMSEGKEFSERDPRLLASKPVASTPTFMIVPLPIKSAAKRLLGL